MELLAKYDPVSRKTAIQQLESQVDRVIAERNAYNNGDITKPYWPVDFYQALLYLKTGDPNHWDHFDGWSFDGGGTDSGLA